MAKPWIHAQSSARKFGGKPEDYVEVHNIMDSSKSVIADNRHRALTHNTWFLFILEKIYPNGITNSDGKRVSVRDIGEQHIAEDFRGRYIPSASDYLNYLEFLPWMNNGISGCPDSARKPMQDRKKQTEDASILNKTFDGARRAIEPTKDQPPTELGEPVLFDVDVKKMGYLD